MANADALLLNRPERDMILAQMPAALSYVSSRLTPASRDDRTIAFGRLECLPAQGVGDDFGKAAVDGYHVALDDIPADLLNTAVERCLKDVRRTFRPSPPELRAYVAADLDERKRAKKRLLAIRDKHLAPVSQPDPEGPFDTSGILAEMNRKLDVGYQAMEGRPMPGASEKPAAVPRNVSTAPRMPTDADYAELRAALGAKPPAERMDQWTAEECHALGLPVYQPLADDRQSPERTKIGGVVWHQDEEGNWKRGAPEPEQRIEEEMVRWATG